MAGETIISRNGPTAVKTRLGWVLSGPVALRGSVDAFTFTTHVLKTQADTDTRSLDKRLHTFWEIEALGIFDREEKVYEQFEKHNSFNNGRYEVSLPWKEMNMALPDNLDLCIRRLHSLLRKLRQVKETFVSYDNVIQEQLQKGIIEPVETMEGGKVYYLPHHAVIRRDKENSNSLRRVS